MNFEGFRIRKNLMSGINRSLVLASLFSAGLINSSYAEAPLHNGYLLNSSGGIINFNGFCIHTGVWTPEMAVPECDPDVVAANQLKNSPASGSAPKQATKPTPAIRPYPVFDSPQPIKP